MVVTHREHVKVTILDLTYRYSETAQQDDPFVHAAIGGKFIHDGNLDDVRTGRMWQQGAFGARGMLMQCR